MKISIDNILPHLAAAGIPSPRLEARMILAFVLGREADEIHGGEYELVPEQEEKLRCLVARRVSHTPLDKLLGIKDFYKYRFRVNEDVLSPRPDTEILVEAALELAWRHKLSTVLDLGSGSGCIILSVLADCPTLTGTAIDKSAPALAVARENASLLGVFSRVDFQNMSWFDTDFTAKLARRYDLIVSNPPYIPAADIPTLEEEVKAHDPLSALDGGKDGLDHYRRQAEIVPDLLSEKGFVLLEGGIGQAKDIAALFIAAGLTLVEIKKDLSGIERCIILKK